MGRKKVRFYAMVPKHSNLFLRGGRHHCRQPVLLRLTLRAFNYIKRSWLRPAFIIGAILGAFLGQLISSAITGKTLQRVPSERTAKRRLHPVLYEWLWSLLGVVILYAVELVSQVI